LQDRRNRHVDKLTKQKKTTLNKTIKEMDSQIKHFSDVADHNRDLVAEQALEIGRLKRSHEQAVLQLNKSYAKSLRSLRSEHADKLATLKATIAEKEEHVRDLEDLANDVAEECNVANTNAEISAAKQLELKATAESRLNKFKTLRERNAELKTTIEEDRELIQELLDSNARLKMELEQSNFDLDDACEEIHVSFNCDGMNDT
jgi:cell division protein FtsB